MTASIETLTRTRDPETSQAAAESLSPDLANELELWVLRQLHRNPLADHELVEYAALGGFRVTPQRIRTVRNSLVLAGLVEHNGGYRFTATHRKARVWAVKP